MSARRRIVGSVALLPVFVCTSTWATEPASLRHNPFSRPPSEAVNDPGIGPAWGGTERDVDLRATMVASNGKLANVAGRILRPGDEINGLTLLEVFEDRAVFASDGRRLTIYVKPELVDDDE